MVEYKINKRVKGCEYSPIDDCILIGFPINTNLTDKAIIEALNDRITHEHIHRAINNNIGNIECCLFDIIEHHFKTVPDCLFKYINTFRFGARTWKEAIEQDGYKYVVNVYIRRGLISESDVKRVLKGWE